MWDRRLRPIIRVMDTGLPMIDAERAFRRATRARRRSALARNVLRRRATAPQLNLLEPQRGGARIGGRVHELPLEAIKGTVEPGRTVMFDGGFRPQAAARRRWQRVWLAEHSGRSLPPISVVQVGDAYAVS